MNRSDLNWRGSSMIWTSNSLTNGSWPFGFLATSDQKIQIKALWQTVSFVPSQVIEVRRYSWPFPSVEIVIQVEEKFVLASFSVLSGRRLDGVLADLDLKVTSRKPLHLGWMKGDRENYGLFNARS